MKYIRTKDDIYELMPNIEQDYEISFDNKTLEPAYYTINHDWAAKKDVIKQANTIEELIDEYVAKKDCSRPFVIKKYEIYSNLQFGFTIYGSIWVDDNLVKVAKMNDEGELELI